MGSPPQKQICYTGSPVTRGIGECLSGIQTCAGGVWGQCDGAELPRAEICDNLDNNCDGKVDDGCPCLEGHEQPCYGGSRKTRNVGPCKNGKQICTGGAWSECTGDVQPTIEIANNSDDDCDGLVDEGAPD
jgi:hypothetical protein